MAPSLAMASELDGQLSTFWLPQVSGFDAIDVLGVVGTRTSTIELGVAVVPIQRQHPVELAQRAFTASAMSGGRFVLGIG